MKTWTKQPNDHLDYDLLLGRWLAADDEVASVDVTAPDGITLTGTAIEPDRVKLWIKGGTSGQSYKFSVLVYTRSRTKEIDFMIAVVEL